MADSADLVCFDCHLALDLGWFWFTDKPRCLFVGRRRPASQSSALSRALWKMLAEHLYHDLRLLGEATSQWDELDMSRLRTIGGDRTNGGPDPTVEEYLGDWPDRVAARPAMAGDTEVPDSAKMVCFVDKVVLPLGSFWASAPPEDRYLFGPDGTPTFELTDLNRALWKMLPEHVYHRRAFLGQRNQLVAEIQPDSSFIVIGGDRPGVDPTLTEYLDDWPG